MNDLKVIVVGIFAMLTTLVLNFRHALNDYGVLDNKLHVEVLAQSNDSGGGGNTNDNQYKCGIKHESCKIKVESEVDSDVLSRRFPLLKVTLNVVMDVSDLTQIYYQGDNITEKVRCGMDKTCYDIILGTNAGKTT